MKRAAGTLLCSLKIQNTGFDHILDFLTLSSETDIHIPGQLRSMQSLTSVSLPVQFFPPFIALGFEHVRMRVIKPLPHDVLHDVQSDQTAQAPSTVASIYI